jgi:hypothetical protein
MIRQAAKICRKAPPFLHYICWLVCQYKSTANLKKIVEMILPNFVVIIIIIIIYVSLMELGHLLARSGLTYPEVS